MSKRALIVEDDDIDVESLKRLFAKKDIKNPVYRATQGIEALDIMRGDNQQAKIPSPFMVILDINMPMMNGIELLKEMRSDEKLKKAPVFILTTSPREEDKNSVYQQNIAGITPLEALGYPNSMIIHWCRRWFLEILRRRQRRNPRYVLCGHVCQL